MNQDNNVRPIVSVINVNKDYYVGNKKVIALRDVSLEIFQGEFIAITGLSGSGKSTLLQLIGGLDTPTGGTIEIDGTNLNNLSDNRLSELRNKMIGFIFQFFYLQPFLSVDLNIELPGMFLRTERKVRRSRAISLAELVGIGERTEHLPSELSGGQMQRVAIARAMLNNPKIILADEPTGNLDSENSKAIIDIFEKIRNGYNTTIIVATHDKDIASRADRIININDGTIL